jgi:2-polyprenyl-3-methyl-5-hydroxy-6-metoxy-1,4-benzoquinol methylase
MKNNAGWDESNKFAEYYDKMTGHKDYVLECDRIEKVIRSHLKSRPDKVLDAGCGTGSHAIELAKRGYTVYGFDVAEAMIEQAIKKDKEKIVRFAKGDIKDYRGRGFDVITALFNVVNYLPDYREFAGFLKDVHDSLDPKGIFIFDSWNALAVAKEKPTTKLRIFDIKEGRIFRYAEPKTDMLKQQTSITYNCLVIKKGMLADEFTSTHVMKFYTPQQTLNALKDAGFETLKTCAGLEHDKEAGETDWIITYVATPKEGD